MAGHGWVYPNEDGSLEPCGGPGTCLQCTKDQSRKRFEDAEREETLEALAKGLKSEPPS